MLCLNRTIVGLKDVNQKNAAPDPARFESNYSRIESATSVTLNKS
ncbi:protein of unknown function [Candidatus Nitrosocaldus cavascurensis]|uniref:Uncharacterized protein n=1 Tax=Candidatus Nitrosocaldus cavascurensis TaxID=2058097 RepID=A0A2K5ARF7_9ARCH|nr:protein of unknown function [Candidatus Nitrosocaldus cavascurensis]